jgi:hypothetical protein
MRGFLLLAIQATMVLSVAAKYEWERHTRPTVWVRAEPFGLDTDHMRTISGEGRYGRLQLHVDVCGLSTANVETEPDYGSVGSSHKVLKANVRTIARGGTLVAVDAGTLRAADVQEVEWDLRQPCTEARLLEIVDVYLPQNVSVPYTVPAGATLWALVTVPKNGPPRPVQLATADPQGFHPWKAQW